MKVGLTGSIGCGKSLVLKYFQDKGWGVVDCDRLAHDLLDTDQEVREALQSKWGAELFNSDGKLDKYALGAIVFKNRDALDWLESLLHPRVNALWTRELECDTQKRAHWIVEIPLLFEKNLEHLFDYTVCVTASPERQRAQLEQRGISIEDATLRMQRQMPLEEKIKRADFVITNDGSREFLKQQVNQLIDQQLI